MTTLNAKLANGFECQTVNEDYECQTVNDGSERQIVNNDS